MLSADLAAQPIEEVYSEEPSKTLGSSAFSPEAPIMQSIKTMNPIVHKTVFTPSSGLKRLITEQPQKAPLSLS